MTLAVRPGPSLAPPAADLRPVVAIGSGAIVRDAHLPAYRLAGIRTVGFLDRDRSRAAALAATEPGSVAFADLADAMRAAEVAGAVFDLALPPEALAETLAALPRGATALVQKPFGRDLAEATRLLGIVRDRELTGAVNFQLRFAPAIDATRRLLADGAIGQPLDLEIRVVCRMPWETWPFLAGMPRMELLMHSIHYLDLARSLFGEPSRVWAQVAGDPRAPGLADVRSTAILAFAGGRRATVSTYHHHAAPTGHDASHLRIEGTRGTIVARLGVNLDYPSGRDDTLEWSRDGGAWRAEPIAGNWFPHAFLGPMRAVQRMAAGEPAPHASDFTDAWRTMALVEAAYASSARGEPVPEPPSIP